MWLDTALKGLLSRWTPREAHSAAPLTRGPHVHVVAIDGTMSTLEPGAETNVGLIYKLLSEEGPRAGFSLHYQAGIQWTDWHGGVDVILGRGINRQIMRAYGFLASRYRPGDRIVLVGYSRGAYAVRSLAGVIDRVGLLSRRHATERNVVQAYRHYRCGPDGEAARAFAARFCRPDVEIEAVAVFDTVKALGLRLPLVWRLTERPHMFHHHTLGPTIRHGFHALALDETREAFAPVLWDCPEGFTGRVEQVWFRGTHGDIGGHLEGVAEARPRANIPLVWMLERLEACGVPLPPGWRARFPQDPDAPSIGSWHGWGRFFVLRRRRVVGLDPSESLHPTAESHWQDSDETPPLAPQM